MKSKHLALLVAAVVVIAGGYFGLNHFLGSGPYDNFSSMMDKLAGPGNWQAQSHEFSLFDRTLTVKGLKIDKSFAYKSDEGLEIKGSPVTIESVAIKNGLSSDELTRIMGLGDWRGQKKTRLADSVLLTGIKTSFLIEPVKSGAAAKPEDAAKPEEAAQPEAAAADGLDVSIDGLGMSGVYLDEAAADAPADFSSFIAALKIDKLDQKGLKYVITAAKNGGSATVTMAMAEHDGISFNKANMPPALFELAEKKFGPWTILGAYQLKRGLARDFKAEVVGPDNAPLVNMSVADMNANDMTGFGKIGALSLSGLDLNVPPQKDESGTEFQFHIKLAKTSVLDLDCTPFYGKIMPVILAQLEKSPAEAAEAVEKFQTIADLFVMPIDLASLSMEGLDCDFGGVVGLKLASVNVDGPYKAGQMPEKQHSVVNGLEVVLPSDQSKLPAGNEAARKAYEFGQAFGMSNFILDSENLVTYNKAAGSWVSETKAFNIKGLVSLTGLLELDGLTLERLAKFAETPLNALIEGEQPVDQILGDLAMKRADFKITDESLLERIYTYVGKTEMDGAPAGDVRKMASSSAMMGIGLYGASVLADPTAMAKSVSGFLEQGGSLKIAFAPEPPLSYASVEKFSDGGDLGTFANSLNLSLQNNNDAPVAVKFSVSAPASDQDLGGGLLDNDEETVE